VANDKPEKKQELIVLYNRKPELKNLLSLLREQ